MLPWILITWTVVIPAVVILSAVWSARRRERPADKRVVSRAAGAMATVVRMPMGPATPLGK